jgi:hypothetical protein
MSNGDQRKSACSSNASFSTMVCTDERERVERQQARSRALSGWSRAQKSASTWHSRFCAVTGSFLGSARKKMLRPGHIAQGVGRFGTCC